LPGSSKALFTNILMKRLNLLLVDDDEDDRMFFEEALSEISPESTILLKKDGKETLSYLLRPDTIAPDILFLDLNMPFIDGVKCLEEIRRTKTLNGVFVVINTTTASKREIDNTFEKGANLFLIKPNSFDELKKSISAIIQLDFHNGIINRERNRFVYHKGVFCSG